MAKQKCGTVNQNKNVQISLQARIWGQAGFPGSGRKNRSKHTRAQILACGGYRYGYIIYIMICASITSSTRTRRGGSCLKDIYKTFLIYRTCMRRAPARPVRACTLRKWCPVSHVTFEAPLRTSRFTLHTSHSTLHTPHSTLHTARFPLHTAHFTLHTSHSTLHTSQSALHTSHFSLLSSHSTLHTSHCTLRAPHFTLHTSSHLSSSRRFCTSARLSVTHVDSSTCQKA